MLQVGTLVEVTEPFFWYEDERHEVGERFVIEEQHIGHNFEKFVKPVAK